MVVSLPLNKKSSRRTGNGKTSRKRFSARAYGVGEEVGEEVVLIVVLDSVFVDVAGEGFTTVVLLSVFLSAGGVTVSVFCSQAASKDAAPAKMQMYFFISCDRPILGHTNIRRKRTFRPCRCGIMSGPKTSTRRQNAGSNGSPWASATARMVSLPARVLTPPTSAGCFLHAPSSPRSASNST